MQVPQADGRFVQPSSGGTANAEKLRESRRIHFIMRSILCPHRALSIATLALAAFLSSCGKEEVQQPTAQPVNVGIEKAASGFFIVTSPSVPGMQFKIYDGCGLVLATVNANQTGRVSFSTSCTPSGTQLALNSTSGCYYLTYGTYFIKATSGATGRKVARITIDDLFDFNGTYPTTDPLLTYVTNASPPSWSSSWIFEDIFNLVNQSSLPTPC
jgi:hypothetical protein